MSSPSLALSAAGAATAEAATSPLQGQRLQQAVRRAEAPGRLVSLLLVLPLLLYGAVFFLVPLAMMVHRAVANPEVQEALPRTAVALAGWATEGGAASDGPPPAAAAALVQELQQGAGSRQLGELARRLNYEQAGYRTLVIKTARQAAALPAPPPDAASWLAGVDERWAEPAPWRALQRAASPWTAYYLLSALDLRQDDAGRIVQAPADQRIYLDVVLRTLGIAGGVTLCCVLLGYPLAALLVRAPRKFALLLTLAILLPFWTSLLARTTAWIVVLQENGLVNGLLQALGLVSRPLTLVFNATGLYIVMVHILLPFTVLPIYSSLKGIPPHLMRASASLGAHPVRGFLAVVLPLSMPGVAAGALLTFIVAAGYYITPSLVGSAREQMLGYFVAFYANNTVNWGMASALGLVLLACVGAVYVVAASTLGVRQLAGLK
ncbi:ABC transporter permease [Aquincola tertiaricarbonis]|uniref:ABC transporter permease n=1 Tax=Aquincola tertiaricarbonis TaxID=391953 RepID=UPI0009FB2945|nr:ABC transporter permease [Aquincola tertiaricarbonis]